MILYINTTSHEEIIIALFKAGTDVSANIGSNFKAELNHKAGSAFRAALIARKKIKASRRQAEKLLPAIDRLLRDKKIKLSALKKIVVANRGGSFTSLRIGVITANALGYALKIPVVTEGKIGRKNKKFAVYSIVEPIYDREPTIGKSKKV